MKVYRNPEHPMLVERCLGGLDNWDAEYFIFNAHSGYDKHQQNMAFFPLLPMAMHTLSKTLFIPLSLVMPWRSVLLISGVFINCVAFSLTVGFLYLLTFEVFRNRRVSILVAFLFCVNPASIFMTSVYSETLFSLFSFSGLLALEKSRPWIASLIFSLGTATRSNGIVLCGFLGYRCLLDISKILHSQESRKIQKTLKSLFAAAFQCIITITPFCVFQYYGYVLYCKGETASSHSVPVWCNWSLPISYTYIQDHYWNVGFLRYFQLKQIPNFVLALPMMLLASICVAEYFTGVVLK